MNINEIFYSIQGEGRAIGRPAIFIRTSGCNLNCVFCDTTYAQTRSRKFMTYEEIDNQIEKYNCKYIVFTGGEPLIQNNTPHIAHLLWIKDSDRVFGIETNGSIYNRNVPGLFHDIVVSPKLDGMTKEYRGTLKKWGVHSDFKYVIRDENDIKQAKKISDVCNPNHSILMPEGTTKNSQLNIIWLCKKCKTLFPDAQVIPRLHILLFEGQEGI